MRSLELCGDQGIPGRLKKLVRNLLIAIVMTYMDTRLPRQSPTSAIFIACLGRSPTIRDFYDECEHEMCLSGTSGCVTLSLLATKA